MTRVLIITITAIITLSVLLADNVSAHPAWGIAIDHNNQIYFSDIETVWKIDAQGKLTVVRAGVSGRHTHDINLDENDNLYGVDNDYEPATQRFITALWKITPAGEFSYIVAPTSNPPKAMTNWKDRAGNSYYVGQSENSGRDIFVLKRTPDGKVTTLAGNRKAGDEYRQVVLYSVGGMAFGPDGALYFTDNSNLRKVTMDGNMAMLASNLAVENRADSPMPESPATRLFGIAVDAQGNAFVADYGNRRVIKVTSGGAVSTVARAEPPWSPTGVALKDGNLYILEFGFTPPSTSIPRVRKLSSDGKITMLAAIGENGKPVAGESSSGGFPERSAESHPGMPYVLLGVVISILALTVVIWRVRRRISDHQHSALK
jgi:sugar lactone lactonase YvrE